MTIKAQNNKSRTRLATISPNAFKDAITSMSDELRRRIDAEVAGFSTDSMAQAKRVKQACDPVAGFRYFCETYFPHYLKSAPNRLHLHLFEALPAIISRKHSEGSLGARNVIIAPRGSAKSTIVTQLFSLWCIILGKRRYIILGMDVYEQAALMLEAVKIELEDNPRLLQDYPAIAGKGRRWREGEIITRNNIRIDAVGSRQKVRGRRHGPHRPDLVVLDDIENDENVRSPEYRDKLMSWVTKAVLKLGASDGSLDFLIVGSLLHYDAVLARLAKAPGFRATSFKAIHQMPDRMDLWERWEEYFLNDNEATADGYYAANRAAMDMGAIVNWPEVQPLQFLMKERAASPAAFASEYQNEPLAENAPFQKLMFWVQKRPNLLMFGAIDPSLGKYGTRGDPSAILVGGFDRETGTLDIIEASIRRRLPDVIIADAIAMQREHQCILWFCEAVQFQEFLRTELMTRSARQEVSLSAIPINPITDKRLRIERLQPPVLDGMIRFRASQTVLIEQLKQFPTGDHDDGPDCLEMLWSGSILHGSTGMLNAGGLRPTRARANITGGYSL